MRKLLTAFLIVCLAGLPINALRAQEVVGKASIVGKATIIAAAGGSAPTIVGFGAIGSALTSTSTFNIQSPFGTNISVPAGTNLYVLAGAQQGSAGTFAITDNCNIGGTSDTFTALEGSPTLDSTNTIGQSFTATTGATVNPCTITITFSVSSAGAVGGAYAYSGSSGIDVHAINPQQFPGSGTNAVTSGSVTTTGTNRLCMGITTQSGSSDTITGGTSSVAWTLDAATTTVGTAAVEHFTQSTAGAITANFTNTTNVNSVPITSIACAKP